MKLENQVCNLELAKKLKELGVKQESLYYYDPNDELTHSRAGSSMPARCGVGFETSDIVSYLSAFTVAELGEMLPDTVKMKDGTAYFSIEKTCTKVSETGNVWEVYYEWYGELGDKISEQAGTEADARAKMLIYLLENNLITL